MKIRFTYMSAMFIAVIFLMQGCGKADPCRTCTAKYGGNTIATKKACSNADEEEFKSAHHYATVSCK